jgi:ribonuclease P protein component
MASVPAREPTLAGQSLHADAPRDAKSFLLDFPLNQKFTREQRLTRKEEYDRVFSQGKKIKHEGITAWLMASRQPRIGCAISRHYGGAVQRNRFKRRVRAAFRQHYEQLPSSDIVVTATSNRGWISYSQIESLFHHLIDDAPPIH